MAAKVRPVGTFLFAACGKQIPMQFRVTYTNKQVVSVQATDGPADPTADTILENNVGETLFATIEAADEAEAREKADRLQTELQTRRTKRDLEGHEGGNG